MTEYKIATMQGDGIGPELLEATLKVLDSVQLKHGIMLKMLMVEGGDDTFRRLGSALPEETIKAVKDSDACLKGPVGETSTDVIVRLRLLFDLYANIRPLKVYPNVPALKPDIDMIIVRENTEDVYRGLELELNKDTMICLRVITRKGSERIIKYAFELAKDRQKKKVTAVHKANVMRKTDGLFAQVFREIAKKYTEITPEEMYVDNAAMQLIRRPEAFDILVTTNMFGDILSDEASITVGGLGMAPSANIGDNFAIFEPAHGSAPKYAGQRVANPTSMILASAMLLDWLGIKHKDQRCRDAAVNIEKAVTKTFTAGILTRDLGGNARTDEFGEAVAKKIIGGD